MKTAQGRSREDGRAAVVFDFDGVIADSEDLHYQAYSRVLEGFGVTVSRQEYGRQWIGAGRGPEHAVATYGLPIEPDELRRRKAPIYRELLSRDVRLMPGAAAALHRLGTRYLLAVATNSGADDTRSVLDRFALSGSLAAVVTREDYERPKPAPDAFLAAAARLGLPPSRCVVVEDAYKGVTAALRAGCACIAVPHAFTADNDFSAATRIVASLDEITVSLIEDLLCSRSEAR